MRLREILLLILGLMPVAVVAQSPFQDAKGNTSLVLPNGGGFAQLKFSEEAATLGYRFDNKDRNFFIFDANVAFDGKSGSIFNGDELAPDSKLGLTYGIYLNPYSIRTADVRKQEVENEKALGPLMEEIDQNKEAIAKLQAENKDFEKRKSDIERGIDDSGRDPEKRAKTLGDLISANESQISKLRVANEDLAARAKPYQDTAAKLTAEKNAIGRQIAYVGGFRVQGQASTFKLYDSSLAFDKAFQSKSFEGWGLTTFLNAYGAGVTYGASIGWERSNNVNDLSLVQVTDTTSVTAPDGTVRQSQTKRSGYKGDYEVQNLVPLRLDIMLRPSQLGSQVGIDLLGRVDLGDGDKRFKPGVGFFLLKKGAPLNVIGGVTLLFDRGRTKAAIVAGINF